MHSDLPMPLSARETEVLNYVALGFSNKEIARELDISCRTVENHRIKILGRLGARNGMHAVALAVSVGLVKVKLTKKLRAAEES